MLCKAQVKLVHPKAYAAPVKTSATATIWCVYDGVDRRPLSIAHSSTTAWKKAYESVKHLLPKPDTRPGSPYDRGGADAHYKRPKNPHYLRGFDRIPVTRMTLAEVQAYNQGYDENLAGEKDYT